jgi:hypothetical protein
MMMMATRGPTTQSLEDRVDGVDPADVPAVIEALIGR